MARTHQLALPEGAESFPNIKIHTLGTRCGVPQPLLGATKASDMEALRDGSDQRQDFRLSPNQKITIRSSHSQLVQIRMKTTNIAIEDDRGQPRPPTVQAWVYYAVRLINLFSFFSN